MSTVWVSYPYALCMQFSYQFTMEKKKKEKLRCILESGNIFFNLFIYLFGSEST